MMRTDDVACRARDVPQGAGRPWRMFADALLDQTPRGFDRIEVMRVRGQKADRRAAGLDELSDRRRFMRVQVVEEHDVTTTEPRRQVSADPGFEALVRHAAPAHPEREPAIGPHGAEQRQVVPPIHRPRFHVFLAAFDPRMRAAHRDIHTRFVDGDQSAWVDRRAPREKRLPFRTNVGSVALTRTPPFFLRTYPSRFIARRKLVAFVRPSRPTRRLYSRQSSSHVLSGRSRTTACSTITSIGERHPP